MFFQLHQPKGKVAFYAVILGLFFGFTTAVSFQRSSRSCSAAASRIYIYLRPFCHLLSITRTDISVGGRFRCLLFLFASFICVFGVIFAASDCCLKIVLFAVACGCLARILVGFMRDWFLFSGKADQSEPMLILEVRAHGHSIVVYSGRKHVLYFPSCIQKMPLFFPPRPFLNFG